jgi:hypothetical protein
MSSREERLAHNEVLFRNVNERIVEIDGVDDDGTYDLICECANANCMAVMRVSPADYAHIRSKPRRFAVITGHELLELEDVIERHDGYLIVEKRVDPNAFPKSRSSTPLVISSDS